ncbi:MAG: geranylgeranylglyceryl/heptaprenylglyceryl phosphate synthase, partial [Candidatus Anstonellales archaeon]
MAINNKVFKYLIEGLQEKKGLFFVLIDPIDHKDLNSCTKIAKIVSENGADAILIGGSIGVQGKLLDDVVKNIKEVINVPVILFPGNIGTISQYADAIYFMSMLNSRSVYWVTTAQMQASLYIKSVNVEPLSVAYCVVEPGGT